MTLIKKIRITTESFFIVTIFEFWNTFNELKKNGESSMNIDLKIGWNDLNDKCKDTIRKLHKLGCKVNIVYPMIESEKTQHPTSMNSCYDRNSINPRTYTSSLNDFVYQSSNSTTEEGAG